MKKQTVQKAHAAAVTAKKKAQPVFEKAEHSAAVSYAIHEFSKAFAFAYAHELVMIASGTLLLSFGIILFGRGAEMLLAYVGNIVATEVH